MNARMYVFGDGMCQIDVSSSTWSNECPIYHDVVLGFIQSTTKHFLEMTASLSDILTCRAIFRGARGYFGPLLERFQLPASEMMSTVFDLQRARLSG